MRRKEVLIIILLVLAVTLPFLNKPYHIDDAFVLHVTGNILENFWDPFSGKIDWFGYELEVWKATTNPPFLSYYLAPFALISDYSEIVLHLAMVPFFLLLAFGMQSLSLRFDAGRFWPLLLLVTAPAVMVSGNVMRDIPGTALGIGGVACFIWGSDRDHRGALFCGALLAGLAAVTKYSAAVILPVMGLYLLLRRKPWQVGWLAVSAGIVGVWCLHNWLVYGQIHMLYLFLERRSNTSILWQDKFFAGLTVLGSSCFLFLVLVLETVRRRYWIMVGVSVALVSLMVAGLSVYSEGPLGLEYLIWIIAGGFVVLLPVLGGLREPWRDFDTLFLAVWLGGVLFFSIFMVPFQAVRHLLPALPPLLLLSCRFLKTLPESGSWTRQGVLSFVVLLQLVVSVLVQMADYEYADSYRKFAAVASEELAETDSDIWFVGHWGWHFYANRAGFRQLHRDGPYPEPGDFVVWPEKVHIGRVFSNDERLRDRLELVSSRTYPGMIPLRTMDQVSKAGFYSVGRGQLPYRFSVESPVEEMRIYRVTDALEAAP